MFGCRVAARPVASKRDGECRYATRLLTLEKGRKIHQPKETASLKACERLLKCDWKSPKCVQNTKLSGKKCGPGKNYPLKDVRNKHPPSDRREKKVHVIVSKRSSSVSVVKSCSVQRSVSVKRVSFSTSVFLSSEESDSDDEMEEQEKRRIFSKTKGTVLKHTTSKMKANYCDARKACDRSAKKAKALKLLREQITHNKKKANISSRELRPRFPYSPTHEWPTARAHRMASLNALAKVHILYENEGRTACSDSNESEESGLLEFLADKNINCINKAVKKEVKFSQSNVKEKSDKISCKSNEKPKLDKQSKKNPITKGKRVKKAKKRKPDTDIEIIDTRMCKRMASLNAQAILAASYLQEKPRKEKLEKKIQNIEKLAETSKPNVEIKEIIVESTCNVQIIEREKQLSPLPREKDLEGSRNANVPASGDRDKTSSGEIRKEDELRESVTEVRKAQDKGGAEVVIRENRQLQSVSSSSESSRTLATTAVSKVGLTEYTEVTKVHINTTQEMEIKEEGKADRKIERILEKDDVAITRMYHYQSKNASQSYCLQMQTTYKPVSKGFSPPPSPVGQPQSGQIHSHVMSAVMPGRPSYYNYPNHAPILSSSQSYPMTHNIGGMTPIMGMDHHIARQYGGSAFTVPHYGHPPHMSYPHNDYGYYQPAGPLIQPIHDQCLIHKPVPYHPQQHPHIHPSSHHSRPPPPPHNRYSGDQCLTHRSLPQAPPPHNAPAPPRQSIPPQPCPIEPIPPPAPPSQQIHHPCNTSVPPPAPPSQQIHHPCNTSVPPPHQMTHHPVNNQTSSHNSHSSLPQPPVPHQQPYNPHNIASSYQCQSHSGPPQNHSHQPGHSYPPSSRYHQEYSSSNYQIPHHPPSAAPPSLPAPQPQSTVCHQDQNSTHAEPSSIPPPHLPLPPTVATSSVPVPKSEPVTEGKSSQGNKETNVVCEQRVCNVSRVEPRNEELHNEKKKHPSFTSLPLEHKITNKCSVDDSKPQLSESAKICHSEKNIVKDVEKIDKEVVEVENKKQDTKRVENMDIEIVYDKTSSDTPEIVEIRENDTCKNFSPKEDIIKGQHDTCDHEEMPDVMVVNVMKKKEVSALIRRARLHGKQRTFRDADNRPLAPYSKVKKNTNAVIPVQQKKIFQPLVSLPRLVLPKKTEKKKYSNGWSWEGEPFEKLVYISNDDPPYLRKCYPSMRHDQGDVIRMRDCVLLKSGLRKTDLPFVAKVTALWENSEDGEMTMSLLWYYRPEHTEHGRKPHHMEDEIFASKHRDINSVACVEDKCYVLTFGEYCRYRCRTKMFEEDLKPHTSVVPELEDYSRKDRLPPDRVSPEMIFFCRKVYDFRQKRILKNPA